MTLLGITGRGTWGVLALFVVTTILLGINGGPPMTTIPGMLTLPAVLLAAVLTVLPGPYPLGLSRTAGIVALCTYCNAAITWQLTPGVAAGWSAWNFGITSIVLFALALRGRILWSWIGFAAMTTVAVSWTFVTVGSIVAGLQMVSLDLCVNLAVSVFAVGLRRTSSRIIELQQVEQRHIEEQAAIDSRREEGDAELGYVRAVAMDSLQLVVAGTSSRETLQELLLVEAHLRDRVRARALDLPPLRSSISAARKRGHEVLVLDDTGDAAIPVNLEDAATWAANQLDQSAAGSVTIRLVRRADELVLTIGFDDARPVATFTVESSRP